MLTRDQVDEYFERGFTMVEAVLDGAMLNRARAIIDGIVAKARSVTHNDDIYDLEESHTPAAPRVRRIKEPVDRDPLFWELVRSDDVIGPVKQLIGPNLRLHGSKLNMKSAGYGAPVQWHQDWAFYPHTNDDLAAVGIMLDDCDSENGPMLIVPGSHKGPIWDHHGLDGRFCGAIDPARLAQEGGDLDLSRALPCLGKAGSVTVHHVRAVHGSATNFSGRERRFLLYQYRAADAWPLLGFKDGIDKFNELLLAGAPTVEPRLAPVPVRLPLPPAAHQGSIYENQRASDRRYFTPAPTARAAAE
jgi:ectoine hydroxylase-related dioxygenase (phytanoyl-CoA dioxygenase family)